MIPNLRSNLTIAFTLMVLAAGFLLEGQGIAQSQRAMVCGGGCGGGCGPCASGGGGGGGGWRAPAAPRPTAAEIADEKSRAQNDQGLAAYNKKDWAVAEAYFRKALKFTPNDRVVLRNLANTLGHEGEDAYRKGEYTESVKLLQQALAIDPEDDASRQVIIDDLAAARKSVDSGVAEVLRQEQQKIQDKLSAGDMRDSLSRMVTSLSSESTAAAGSKTPGNTSAGSGGLTFTDAGPALKDAVADTHSAPATSPAPDAKTSGNRAPANTGNSTGLFGSPGTPANTGLEFTAAPPALAVGSSKGLRSNSAKEQLFNSGRETTGELFDNGKAHDDNNVDTSLPDVGTPSAQARPLDVKLARDKDYQAAATELTQAQSKADTVNKKMAELQGQQKAGPTPERQIEISNLSAQASVANGAVVLAQNNLDTVKKKIIESGPAIIVEDSTPAPAQPTVAPESKVKE